MPSLASPPDSHDTLEGEKPSLHIEVSTEWAKKLRLASFPQKAHWFWIEYRDNPEKQPDTVDFFLWGASRNGSCSLSMNGTTHLNAYAAPTAEEILRRLPKGLVVGYWSGFDDPNLLAKCGWPDPADMAGAFCPDCINDTLANAAAAMYCYLADHKLLPPQV